MWNNIIPSSIIVSILMMEATRSSETLFIQKPNGVTFQKAGFFRRGWSLFVVYSHKIEGISEELGQAVSIGQCVLTTGNGLQIFAGHCSVTSAKHLTKVTCSHPLAQKQQHGLQFYLPVFQSTNWNIHTF
jgi:hypothetical protein